MHLFIVTQSEMSYPILLMDSIIMDMVIAVGQPNDIDIVLVGEHFSRNLKHFQAAQPNITLASTKEAGISLKKMDTAMVIHFGTNTSWAGKHPVYFFPLTTPDKIVDQSFLSQLFLKRAFSKWLEKSAKLCFANDWTWETFAIDYPNFKDKMQMINLPVRAPVQFSWTQLAEAKEALTYGHNYFMIFAPVERFVAILKEFSIFKKWQQTTMNLVVILDNKQQLEKAMKLLQGYKFKQDIVIHTIDDLNMEWIANSYAILWEGVDASKTNWMENAIQYEIPLLLDTQLKLPTHWTKAGEVFSFMEQQALSNHFKLYYKDEIYRQSRARMGKEWYDTLSPSQGKQELFNKIVLSHIN